MKLKLDYLKWRCGNDLESPAGCLLGSGPTYLMTGLPEHLQSSEPTHNCCCVGLMLLDAGAPVSLVQERVSAVEVMRHSAGDLGAVPLEVREILGKMIAPDVDSTFIHTHFVDELYRANDDSGTEGYRTVGAKMVEITKLCAAEGIEIEWINVPEEPANTDTEQ